MIYDTQVGHIKKKYLPAPLLLIMLSTITTVAIPTQTTYRATLKTLGVLN
jgi:hypothetical protein